MGYFAVIRRPGREANQTPLSELCSTYPHPFIACTRKTFYLLAAFAKLRNTPATFVMSVCLSIFPSVCLKQLGRIFKKYDILFFENLSRKFKFIWNIAKITGTSHEDLCSVMLVPCWNLLRMRNVSEKNCIKDPDTHLMIHNSSPHPPPPENRTVYEMLWKNMLESYRPKMTI